MTTEHRRVISVLVENQFGVLARVSGLFSGKGYNIDSLTVAETLDPKLSRMTIVTHGDERIIDQIVKQLNKLVDVVRVVDLTDEPHVERELVLIKVAADASTRGEIIQIADIFRARVVDVAQRALTIETTGDEGKIVALISMMEPYGVIDMVRTGKLAIGRGTFSTLLNDAEHADAAG
ncbi:MAG: acetolactate synthase small subunit [Candidatus Poribacteria bacterium]|nr:acetolactate synthase small subunit [Candidatus Poribacteria bacterium]